MARTFAQVLIIVEEFCRINTNDTKLVTLCTNAIDMAFYDVAREQRWGELLILRSSITMTGAAAGTLLDVPDHIGIEEVMFKSLLPLRTWELVEKNQVVPPAPLFDRPRSYQIVQGNLATPTQFRMSVEPFAGILAADTILFSYFMVPSLFSLMTSPNIVTSPNWDNEVIKRAEHYVSLYMGKAEIAQGLWQEILGKMGKQSNETQAA